MASSSSHHSNNHQIQSLKNCQDKNKAEEEEEEEDDDDEQEEEEEEEDDDEDHKEWLQLKLGLGSGGTSSSKLIVGHHYHHRHNELNPESRSAGSSVGLGLELGLGLGLGLEVWPNNNVNSEKEGLLEWSRFINERVPIPSSSSCQVVSDSQSQHWFNINMPIIPPALPSQSHHCNSHTNPNVSGLWFTLHSSTNRKGEALPQIPKAYIRVKNENMTVFMVKKYLVRKLGLSNENEVDILCMGQSLLDVQSLRHVRDCIWIPTLVHSLNSSTSRDISTTNLMPLLYQIKISHF